MLRRCGDCWESLICYAQRHGVFKKHEELVKIMRGEREGFTKSFHDQDSSDDDEEEDDGAWPKDEKFTDLMKMLGLNSI